MSRREKRNKEATAGRGDLALLTALVFDAAGAPLPTKDKERLELTERDFVEVLVRLAFLRKIRRDERAQIAEWRGFQAQRREEMRRERDRPVRTRPRSAECPHWTAPRPADSWSNAALCLSVCPSRPACCASVTRI